MATKATIIFRVECYRFIAIVEIDEAESTHQVKQKSWIKEWRKHESNHNNLRVDLCSDKYDYKFTGEIVRIYL